MNVFLQAEELWIVIEGIYAQYSVLSMLEPRMIIPAQAVFQQLALSIQFFNSIYAFKVDETSDCIRRGIQVVNLN